MPAVVVFGRRWHVASDDLPVFSFFGALFHACISPFLAACLGLYTDCLSRPLLAYLSMLLIVDVCCSFIFVALGLVGLRGTLLEQQKRASAPSLLTLLTGLYVALTGASCYGVYSVLYISASPCGGPWGVLSFSRAMLALHWASVSIFIISWAVVWNPFTGSDDGLDGWVRRCKCLVSLACLSSQKHPRVDSWTHHEPEDDPIHQVAALFHGLLSHVDLTVSDYASSLVLVGVLQRMRRRRERKDKDRQHRDIESQTTSGEGDESNAHAEGNVSQEDVKECQHYFEYAAGAYGWPMHIFRHRTDPCQACAVCCGCCTCCLPSRAPDPHPSSSTTERYRLNLPRNLHVEAIRRATGIDISRDLLYHSLDNEVEGLIPYYIAIDRERRSLVISIRGSLSGTDVLTDVLCYPSKVDSNWMRASEGPQAQSMSSSMDDGKEGEEAVYAHQGMLMCAYHIAEDIEKKGVLRAVLLGDERAKEACGIFHEDCKGWRLVVTGHSLGGGVAALLSMHLRAMVTTNIHCFAFAPPGGLISSRHARTMTWVTGVVIGRDMMSRLSLQSIEALCQDMLLAAARTKVTKTSLWLQAIFGFDKKLENEEDWFLSQEDISPEAREMMEKLKQGVATCLGDRTEIAGARDFRCPGSRILYFEKLKLPVAAAVASKDRMKPKKKGKKDYRFLPRWISGEELANQGLAVSGRMFAMHVPDFQAEVLRDAIIEEPGI